MSLPVLVGCAPVAGTAADERDRPVPSLGDPALPLQPRQRAALDEGHQHAPSPVTLANGQGTKDREGPFHHEMLTSLGVFWGFRRTNGVLAWPFWRRREAGREYSDLYLFRAPAPLRAHRPTRGLIEATEC